MNEIERSALLPFPAAEVFHIVDDVARYPEFLPWCAGAVEQSRSAEEVVAALSLQASGMRETFTTRNRRMPHERIELELVSGPFRELRGAWSFRRLGNDDGCRVQLELSFQFSGARGLLLPSFARVFTGTADRLVDAFCERAYELLG